jgi:hypothetical protein
MDFKLVIVVLFAYFIRPQDWLPGMAGTNIMKPLMAITLIAMVTRRRGFMFSSLAKSPIDWAVIAYGIYIIVSAPEGQRPVGTVFVYLAYFFVTSQGISTSKQLAIFVRCWAICIFIVAGMAVMSEYGLDLTGAREITNLVADNPRLVLNTYLFNNANSLGHTVVIGIPLAYFIFFWKRPISRKLLALALLSLSTYCVYLTKSKGAYIVGFIVVIASQLIGQRRIFQLIGVLLAATLGWGALSQLPRMTEMSSIRRDEAIMGRMLAWEQARQASQESASGKGFKNFKPLIEFEDEQIEKATHSSYVLIGAELGRNGMFFYLAVLYAALRILVTARCYRQDDERSRKALFVLLLGYLFSSWLIDRSYHLEYFLLAGAVSSLHRRLGVETGVIEQESEVIEDEPDDEEEDEGKPETARPPELLLTQPAQLIPEPMSGPALAYSTANVPAPIQASYDPGEQTFTSIGEVDTSEVAEQAIEEELRRRWFWHRIGILDVLLVLLFTKVVFEIWDYLLKTYFV